MKVQCPICAELFVAGNDISATTCGHTFHFSCLLQWQQQSHTCPQCRTRLGRKDVIAKLYFDHGEDGGPCGDDLANLCNRNDELEAKLQEANHEVSVLKELIASKDEIVRISDKDLRMANSIAKELRLKLDNLKSQVMFLRKENTRLGNVDDELIVAKRELENYKMVQTLIDGSVDDTNNILMRYSKDPSSLKELALYCVMLQKELQKSKTSQAQSKQKAKSLAKNLEETQLKVSRSTVRASNLETENHGLGESLASAERELQSMRKKYEQMLQKLHEVRHTQNTSFERQILESPAPMPLKPHDDSDAPEAKVAKRDKPSAAENYRDLKACSMAVNMAMNFKVSSAGGSSDHRVKASTMVQCQNFNIFKSRHKLYMPTALSKNHGYDGFGGHSKPDVFPEARKNMKRHNSATTLTTLDNFFKD